MSFEMPQIIQNRKIKIAVLGLGRISQFHFDAIQKHANELELVAVCDMQADYVNKKAQEYQVLGFTDFETMLKEIEIDLVAICTPSGLHPAQTILAARYGCHVITEKPMATHWQDGIDMVKACQEADVFLFVVKQNRWNKTMQYLKEAIELGRFGKIYLASANVFWARSQSYYNQGGWRGSRAMDGGAFMNQASHYIDLLHWLLGPVQSVGAMMGTLARQIECEDTGVLSVRWRSGAMGSVNVTTLTYPDDKEGSLTILGEKGSVKFAGKALNQLQWWEFSEKHDMDRSIHEISYETDSVYGFGHPYFYQNVIESIQGIAKPLVDGHEGLASLEILVAAYRAARDNIVVNLPLEI
jgi:UDP-N-acetyl-2-amino-2-deoxyglucuronate dehydrogenase